MLQCVAPGMRLTVPSCPFVDRDEVLPRRHCKPAEKELKPAGKELKPAGIELNMAVDIFLRHGRHVLSQTLGKESWTVTAGTLTQAR